MGVPLFHIAAIARVPRWALVACFTGSIAVAAFAQDVGPMPRGEVPRHEVPAIERRGLGESLPTSAGGATPPVDAAERQPLGARSAAPGFGPSSGSAPAGSQGSNSLAGTVRTVLSLGGVIAIIVGAAHVFKRISRSSGGLMNQLGAGGRAPSGVLSILGRYPVSRGTTLVLLKADRRVLLLCQTAGKGFTGGCTMQTLTEFTDPEDVASILLKTRDEEEASLAQRFEAMLSKEDEAAARTLNPEAASRRPEARTVARAPAGASPMVPTTTRSARVAAKQPESVLRPVAVPSDPRAQMGLSGVSERGAARTEGVRPEGLARGTARVSAGGMAGGPLLRGVVG